MNIGQRGRVDRILNGDSERMIIWEDAIIYCLQFHLLSFILAGDATKLDRTSKTAQPARRLLVLSTGEIIVELPILPVCSV